MPSKELVSATTVPLVLALLAERESYGYALIKRVRELSDAHLQWTEGMLYPVLRWMEENDLIASEWREVEGRQRKYYRLRPKGRTVLARERAEWLAVHQTFDKLWNNRPHST